MSVSQWDSGLPAGQPVRIARTKGVTLRWRHCASASYLHPTLHRALRTLRSVPTRFSVVSQHATINTHFSVGKNSFVFGRADWDRLSWQGFSWFYSVQQNSWIDSIRSTCFPVTLCRRDKANVGIFETFRCGRVGNADRVYSNSRSLCWNDSSFFTLSCWKLLMCSLECTLLVMQYRGGQRGRWTN